MILLAIETATLEVGAAVVGERGTLAEWRARPGRRHVETLHPAVREVLAASGVVPADLAGVAVDVGPGLFTGLRVGVAAAKAFGLALGVPLCAVTSTEVLAHDAQATATGAVVPVVDLRRGEVAWQLPGAPLARGRPEELVGALGAIEGDVLLVGDGALSSRAVLEAHGAGRWRVGGEDLAAPSVGGVGAIGYQRLVAAETTTAAAIEAIYLRPADARANFATRSGVGDERR